MFIPVPCRYAFLIDATGDGELDLVVASFAAFEAGSVSLISNASSIKTALASGTAAPATVVLTTDLFWPNWIEIAPARSGARFDGGRRTKILRERERKTERQTDRQRQRRERDRPRQK